MAQDAISKFFRRLGFPLRNERNSWGAVNGSSILLRTWSDEFTRVGRKVVVLKDYRRPGGTTSGGLNERKGHLRALWEGGIAGYVVIITPAGNDNEGGRKIGTFRDDAVFPIQHLVEDGNIFAVLGDPVAVSELGRDMQSRRVTANATSLPPALLEKAFRAPEDVAGKRAFQASEMRAYLIDAASRQATVTYGELFNAFDLNFRTLPPFLGIVGHQCLANGEPILTSIVVLKDTGRCAEGLEREFGVSEDVERPRVFSHWLAISADRGGADCTDFELLACVASYREMIQLDVVDVEFKQVAYHQRLAQRFGRGNEFFAVLMEQISQLLDERGLAIFHGRERLTNVVDDARLLPFLEGLIRELTPVLTFPEEVGDLQGVVEGAKKQITVNSYERDPTAKPRCVKRWGTICCICDFNFEAVYGQLGKGFIHVHHLNPIATIGESYKLDPENDLRPVCPNCHSMLHRTRDTLTINELKALLRLKFVDAFE